MHPSSSVHGVRLLTALARTAAARPGHARTRCPCKAPPASWQTRHQHRRQTLTGVRRRLQTGQREHAARVPTRTCVSAPVACTTGRLGSLRDASAYTRSWLPHARATAQVGSCCGHLARRGLRSSSAVVKTAPHTVGDPHSHRPAGRCGGAPGDDAHAAAAAGQLAAAAGTEV